MPPKKSKKQMALEARDTLPILITTDALEGAREDPYTLVKAVLDYVQIMHWKRYFSMDMLPPEAAQTFYCVNYFNEVYNGGHSQFIYNTRFAYKSPDDKERGPAIEAGLLAVGATEMLAIFTDMITWIQENPKTAKKQTGFNPGRAEYLNTLDKRFYDVEQIKPLFPLMATWLGRLDKLKAVPESDIRLHFGKLEHP